MTEEQLDQAQNIKKDINDLEFRLKHIHEFQLYVNGMVLDQKKYIHVYQSAKSHLEAVLRNELKDKKTEFEKI